MRVQEFIVESTQPYSFTAKKSKGGFTVNLFIANKPAGIFQFSRDRNTGDVRNIAEVFPEFRGKGYGRLLLLKAIHTATELGIPFEEDSHSMTSAQSSVYDSLDDDRFIINDDGYWYITQDGLDYLEGKRIEESVVTEYEKYTDNSKQIFAELKKAGYEYLGGGVDATVWGRDEGEVLKVLMPQNSKADAERGFLTFHKACTAMKNNPHVPRFLENYSVFELNGTDYMQITMERLQPIPNGSIEEAMVWGLSELATVAFIKWRDVDAQLSDPAFWEHCESDVSLEQIGATLGDAEAMNEYKALFATMLAFHKLALKAGMNWDLHTENVMQRADGTLVITDPFMV